MGWDVRATPRRDNGAVHHLRQALYSPYVTGAPLATLPARRPPRTHAARALLPAATPPLPIPPGTCPRRLTRRCRRGIERLCRLRRAMGHGAGAAPARRAGPRDVRRVSATAAACAAAVARDAEHVFGVDSDGDDAARAWQLAGTDVNAADCRAERVAADSRASPHGETHPARETCGMVGSTDGSRSETSSSSSTATVASMATACAASDSTRTDGTISSDECSTDGDDDDSDAGAQAPRSRGQHPNPRSISRRLDMDAPARVGWCGPFPVCAPAGTPPSRPMHQRRTDLAALAPERRPAPGEAVSREETVWWAWRDKVGALLPDIVAASQEVTAAAVAHPSTRATHPSGRVGWTEGHPTVCIYLYVCVSQTCIKCLKRGRRQAYVGKMVARHDMSIALAQKNLMHSRSRASRFDRVLAKHPRCVWVGVVERYRGPPGELPTKRTVGFWENRLFHALRKELLNQARPFVAYLPDRPVLGDMWPALESALARFRARTGNVLVSGAARDPAYGPGTSFGTACTRVREERGRGPPLIEQKLTDMGWDWSSTEADDLERRMHAGAADLVVRMERFLRAHGSIPRRNQARVGMDAFAVRRRRAREGALHSTFRGYVYKNKGFCLAHARRLEAAWREGGGSP